MMAFYIKPPEGNISLSRLYEDTETRLLFLCQVHQRWGDSSQVRNILVDHPSIASNSECLIEGSRKDRISHFVLRLVCQESEQLQIFLTEAEMQLFQYRLESGGDPAIIHSMSDLKRHSSYALKHMTLTPAHRELMLQVQKMTSEIIASGMVECSARMSCHHSVKVPWTMVVSLVKGRNVIVIAGEVEIHCQNLLQLLCSVFRITLELGVKQLSHCGAQDLIINDVRMNRVKKSLFSLYRKQQGGGHMVLTSHILKCRDVENQVLYFPLCMQELHKILSSTSRLRHHARIRYTLFLKDIGLPIMENIALWENFYSKAHKGTSSGCSHSWDGRDRNRYTYGIRHLYGMEGGKTNYTSHSCSSLQSLWSQPSDTGGCPFTSRGQEELSFLLSPILGNNIQLLDAIMKEVRAGRPNAACKILLAFTVFMQREYKRRQECGFNQFQSQGTLKDLDKVENDRKCIVISGENSSVYDSNDDTLLPKTSEEQSSVSIHVRKNRFYTDKNLAYPGNYDCNRKQEKVRIHIKGNDSPCTHCLKDKDIKNSQKYVSSSRCNSIKNEFHNMVCDIEDLKEIISECNFMRPSHYYFKAKSESGI